MNTATRLGVIAIVTVLAGCEAVGMARLEPGRSSESDLRAALGEPARVFTDADGSRQFVYPRGPEGARTYMAYLAPDGRLRRIEQALNDDTIRRIAIGSMDTTQLERLIGPPWRKVAFPNKRQVAWDYVLQDSWGYTVDFAVMVDERGIVAETAYVRRERGNDSGFGNK